MEQKKYDIFVSYSRADMDVVKRLVGDIHEKTNASCWVDWNGIESGDQFVDVIINAIDKVDTVLFVLSDNSMSSEFARKEIDYARNTGKKIVPVVVDGGKLRGWFLFFFGSVDYIDIKVPMQYEKLLRNLGEWYGGESAADVTSFPIHSKESSKIYKIGDFYDVNGKQGIVFDVTPDGKHGKIVGLEEGKALWAVYDVKDNVTGATSEGGGMSNMNKIKQQPNWKNNYPAFAWCASKGQGWYLPAVDEFKLIFENRDVINRMLNLMGYGEFQRGYYWSSTESTEKKSCAWSVYMSERYSPIYGKSGYGSVRAVSAF